MVKISLVLKQTGKLSSQGDVQFVFPQTVTRVCSPTSLPDFRVVSVLDFEHALKKLNIT